MADPALAGKLEALAEALGGELRGNPEGGPRAGRARSLADIARDAGLPAVEAALRCAPPRRRPGRAESDAVAAFTRLDPRDVPDDMLLAMMLSGEGGPPLVVARAILEELGGSLKRVLEPEMTRPVAGVAPVDAARLTASVELARRATVRDSVLKGRAYRSLPDVVELLRSMALGPVESLVALYLSRRLQLIATRVLSRGTESMTLADPKTIISIGLRFGASAVIIAHNHPSGDVEPSQEDLLMTRSLQSAMHGVGMQLIDHVIVTETGATSLRERGQVR